MILGITLGDVTGIGPEVALRAVARLTAEDTDVHYVLIGDTGVVRRLCGLMGVEADLPFWRGVDSEPSRVYVLPVSEGELPESLSPGDPRAALEAVAALRDAPVARETADPLATTALRLLIAPGAANVAAN
jgi:4-hydroxy-L-threonine phosphate dehydrogenase PdxA